MPSVLELHGVSKRYGGSTVLRDVSFSLKEGTITTITGRSGSGKSTLFRLLAGLERPTSGRIVFEGSDMSALDDGALSSLRLHRLGLVFQSLNLLPDLTVLENVSLPMEIAGRPRAAARARALELLRLVHIEARAAQRPAKLSGGEAQRVAIARALANAPAILLADEPTGSLDRANAANVLDVLAEANQTLGTTVLLITHDPVAMQRFRSRLAIDDGRLDWHGNDAIVDETHEPTP